MRIYLFLAIILVGSLLAAAGAQAFVSSSANVDKENGYAILKPAANESFGHEGKWLRHSATSVRREGEQSQHVRDPEDEREQRPCVESEYVCHYHQEHSERANPPVTRTASREIVAALTS